MTHVWVIEQGEYSDYHVVGVYTSREKAKLVAKALKAPWGYKPVVSQWPLNPGVDKINAGLTRFGVRMLRDGTVEWVMVQDFDVNAQESYNLIKVNPHPLYAEVWARDKKHAVKIVNERRAQMIANGEWK